MIWVAAVVALVLVVVAVRTTSMIVRGCVIAAGLVAALGGGASWIVTNGLNAVHNAVAVDPHDLATRSAVASLGYPGATLHARSFVSPSGSVQTAVRDDWASTAPGAQIIAWYAAHLDATSWPGVTSCYGATFTRVRFDSGPMSWSNGGASFAISEHFTVVVAGHVPVPAHAGAPTAAPTPTPVTLIPVTLPPGPGAGACGADTAAPVDVAPAAGHYTAVLTAGPPRLTF